MRLGSETLLFLAHAVALAAVAVVVFARMRGILFTGLEGASMLTNVGPLTPPAAGYFANPLQGLGDIWFNFDAWLSPGYLLPAFFLGWDGLAGVGYRVVVYTVHALLLFLAVAAFARTLGMLRTEALVGASVKFLFVFPVYGAPLVYPIFEIQPNLTFTIAESYLLLFLFGLVGRRLTASWGLAPIGRASSGHHRDRRPFPADCADQYLPCCLFPSPAESAFCWGPTTGERSRRRSWPLSSSSCSLQFRFYDFVLGIFRYTDAAEQGADFKNVRTSWYFVSIAFQKAQRSGRARALRRRNGRAPSCRDFRRGASARLCPAHARLRSPRSSLWGSDGPQ